MACLTVCPPHAAHQILKPDWQWGRGGQLPVSEGTGLDYSDLTRIQTSYKSISGGRRLSCPEWAVNPAQLRELLVWTVESRAYIPPRIRHGNERERLAYAQRILNAQQSKRAETLKRLCKEYAFAKRAGTLNNNRQRRLETEIENLDTVCRINGNLAGIILRVVNLYYSCGYNSTEIAAEVGIKPPHTRKLIWSLHRNWRDLQAHKAGTFVWGRGGSR